MQHDSTMQDGSTMQDWRLTTAEILYRLPDHPQILQTYVWQAFDLAPRYPSLQKFLDFWSREIEGRLHSVRVAAQILVPSSCGRLVLASGPSTRLH